MSLTQIKIADKLYQIFHYSYIYLMLVTREFINNKNTNQGTFYVLDTLTSLCISNEKYYIGTLALQLCFEEKQI